MMEDRLSARERELLDDMRKEVDRLSRIEPSDLFTRGDSRLIYENKGLLQENSKLRQDLELMKKAQRPIAPERDGLVEWLITHLDGYAALGNHECAAIADALIASDLFAQEPARNVQNLALQKEALRAQRDVAQAERDRLRQHLEDANEQLAQLQVEYDELEKESNRSQQMIMDLNIRNNAGKESRDRLRDRIAELEKERDEALRKVDEAEVHGRKAADWAWKRNLEDAKAEAQKRLDVQQSIIESQNKELQAKDKAIAEDIEEIDKLRGDVNVSREAYRHMVASHNELADLVIKEFGSFVAEEGTTEAAIRLLREQRDRIAELEQELAHRSPKQKGAADSAVNAAADIASTLAAGIREWNEKKRKWEG